MTKESVFVKKVFYIIILLLFCVPYAYLSVYLELAGWGLWGYFMAVTVPYILSSQASKLDNKYIVIAGNMLSFATSYYCVINYATEKWTYFCTPFGPMGTIKVISLFILLFSFAGWHIQKEIMDRKSKKKTAEQRSK